MIRSKTHEVQTAPAEKREEAKAWDVTVVPILPQLNRHQDWIANMDQTPVPNRILSEVQKSFWSCTHVNSCQKYTLYINLHILLNILS